MEKYKVLFSPKKKKKKKKKKKNIPVPPDASLHFWISSKLKSITDESNKDDWVQQRAAEKLRPVDDMTA